MIVEWVQHREAHLGRKRSGVLQLMRIRLEVEGKVVPGAEARGRLEIVHKRI